MYKPPLLVDGNATLRSKPGPPYGRAGWHTSLSGEEFLIPRQHDRGDGTRTQGGIRGHDGRHDHPGESGHSGGNERDVVAVVLGIGGSDSWRRAPSRFPLDGKNRRRQYGSGKETRSALPLAPPTIHTKVELIPPCSGRARANELILRKVVENSKNRRSFRYEELSKPVITKPGRAGEEKQTRDTTSKLSRPPISSTLPAVPDILGLFAGLCELD